MEPITTFVVCRLMVYQPRTGFLEMLTVKMLEITVSDKTVLSSVYLSL